MTRKKFGGELTNILEYLPEVTEGESITYLLLTDLHPGKYQPRKYFDETQIQELATSIKEEGVLQPLLVRKNVDGPEGYEIIAGERRWRAAGIAGLERIPCIVRDLSDKKVGAISLIENIQRENLNPIEEAIAYSRLLNDFDLTHELVAQQVGKSRAAITNSLRLLKLDPSVQELVIQGKLEMGHARALISLKLQAQIELAQRIIEKKLTVRQAEEQVRKVQASHYKAQPELILFDSAELERQFKAKLKLPVKITVANQGRINITIQCEDEQQACWLLDRVVIA